VAQLEHRIEQIEEFLRPLREGRAEITPVKSFPLPEENDLYRHNGSATAGDPGKLPSNQGNQHNANEIGEADTSEDPIDGMAAISFQYEQDAGFFGMPLFV
jgi:hypothetical protein